MYPSRIIKVGNSFYIHISKDHMSFLEMSKGNPCFLYALKKTIIISKEPIYKIEIKYVEGANTARGETDERK